MINKFIMFLQIFIFLIPFINTFNQSYIIQRIDKLIYTMQQQQQTHNAQLSKLRDKHQLTVMELTDLKQDYEKIKQLNTTLVQNFNKGPQDTLKQLRLIIDGSYSHQRILQLQDKLHQYQLKEGSATNQQNDRNYQIIQQLKRVILEKDQLIDRLRLQLQEKQHNFISLNSKNNNKYLLVIKEKEQVINKLEHQQNRIRQQYQDLCHKFQGLMAEVEEYRKYYEGQANQDNQQYYQTPSHQKNNKNNHDSPNSQNVILLNGSLMSIDDNNSPLDLPFKKHQQQYGVNTMGSKRNAYAFTTGNSVHRDKENKMKMEIQNILGELGNNNRSRRGNQSRISSMMGQSGINGYHDFSIKDGVNRPNQISFY